MSFGQSRVAEFQAMTWKEVLGVATGGHDPERDSWALSCGADEAPHVPPPNITFDRNLIMSDIDGTTAVHQDRAGLQEPPADPLTGLLERVEHIDRVVSRLERLADQAPSLLATAVDVLDETCRRAGEVGIDPDERVRRLLTLAERFTADGTFQTLERLLMRAEELEGLLRKLDQWPALLAMLGDVFDEWAAKMAAQGIDVETSVRQGLHAALWLGQRISEPELERLGILIRSDVLEPHALAVIGKTGRALATGHEGTSRTDGSERIGLFGLLRTLRDPDMQRTLAFVARVAQDFGHHLPDPAEIPIRPASALAPV